MTEEEKILRLKQYGILGNDPVRNHNIGKSNYAANEHLIQPWAIWMDYPELTSWDHDIIKRVLRTKKESGMTPSEARKLDYQKIIHDCQERIRQIDMEYDNHRSHRK